MSEAAWKYPARYGRQPLDYIHRLKAQRLTDQEIVLYLYINANRHSQMEGIYPLPMLYIAADLHWPRKQVTTRLGTLEGKNLIAYDPQAELILKCDALAIQWPENPKVTEGVKRRVTAFTQSPLFVKWLHLVKALCGQPTASDTARRFALEIQRTFGTPVEQVQDRSPAAVGEVSSSLISNLESQSESIKQEAPIPIPIPESPDGVGREAHSFCFSGEEGDKDPEVANSDWVLDRWNASVGLPPISEKARQGTSLRYRISARCKERPDRAFWIDLLNHPERFTPPGSSEPLALHMLLTDDCWQYVREEAHVA